MTVLNNVHTAHRLFGVLMLAFSLVLTSCHSTKQLAGGVSGNKTDQTRFEQLAQSTFKYEALQSKVKYSMGKSSLGGKLCLESGKKVGLQVNAPVLGFEVARVEASQQEVLLVDKYDKLYTQLDISSLYDIEELKGHEMEALECLMLGHVFIPGKGVATAKDYGKFVWKTLSNADGSQGNSEATYQGKDYSIVYTIDNNGQLVSTQLNVGAKSATWSYTNYQEVEKGKVVPTAETIQLNNGDDKTLSAGLTLTNPQFGESTWRDFEPSGSYKQVTAAELGKAIKSIAK